jgi:hypothetical protein
MLDPLFLYVIVNTAKAREVFNSLPVLVRDVVCDTAVASCAVRVLLADAFDEPDSECLQIADRARELIQVLRLGLVAEAAHARRVFIQCFLLFD